MPVIQVPFFRRAHPLNDGDDNAAEMTNVLSPFNNREEQEAPADKSTEIAEPEDQKVASEADNDLDSEVNDSAKAYEAPNTTSFSRGIGLAAASAFGVVSMATQLARVPLASEPVADTPSDSIAGGTTRD